MLFWKGAKYKCKHIYLHNTVIFSSDPSHSNHYKNIFPHSGIISFTQTVCFFKKKNKR